MGEIKEKSFKYCERRFYTMDLIQKILEMIYRIFQALYNKIKDTPLEAE